MGGPIRPFYLPTHCAGLPASSTSAIRGRKAVGSRNRESDVNSRDCPSVAHMPLEYKLVC